PAGIEREGQVEARGEHLVQLCEGRYRVPTAVGTGGGAGRTDRTPVASSTPRSRRCGRGRRGVCGGGRAGHERRNPRLLPAIRPESATEPDARQPVRHRSLPGSVVPGTGWVGAGTRLEHRRSQRTPGTTG